MISIFDYFKNSIDQNKKELLQKIGFSKSDVKMEKIISMILFKDEFKEQNIINSAGFFELLRESNDIQKTLDYINLLYPQVPLQVSTQEKIVPVRKSNNWKKRILTEFVCEFYGNDGCTTYGERISRSLIRVAATRIFADPEQSIMELPVNSVDSYKTLEGGKSIGKFGMGFFSIFYWIIQPLNGQYNRFITIETAYNSGSYKCIMKWTNDGLLIEKEELENKLFNGKQTTGTRIILNFYNHPLDNITVNKIIKYIIKLKFVKDAKILLNLESSKLSQENKKDIKEDITNLNNSESENLVNIIINQTGIIIEDNAAGISFDTLENSLLVPSSSTKQRNIVKEDFRDPLIISSDNPKLYIVVNGISIVEIPCENKDYIILMPSNTKLPVSRDDIIFTDYEIEYFNKACRFIIKQGFIFRDLYDFMITLEKYTLLNKSLLLREMIKKIRYDIEATTKILIPKTSFWEEFSKLAPSVIRSKLAYYDQVNIFVTEKKLDKYLVEFSENEIYKLKKVIFLSMKESMETGGFSEYLFISNKSSFNSSDFALKENNTLLIPFKEEYDVDFLNFEVENILVDGQYLFNYIDKEFLQNTRESYRYLNKNTNSDIYKYAKLTKMTFTKKYLNYVNYLDIPNLQYNKIIDYFIECYIVILYTVFKKYNIVEELIPYIVNLNSKLTTYKIKSAYGVDLTKKLKQDKIIDSNMFKYDFNCKGDEVIKMFKDSLLMFNELFNLDSHIIFLNIPTMTDYIFYNINPNAFTNKKLYNELILSVKETSAYVETFNIVKIFFRIDKQAKNVIKCDGLGIYILDEIRKRISSDNLLKLHKDFFSYLNFLLESQIFNPIISTALSYINFMSQKRINKDIIVFGRYKFSAKQLIEYLFNNNSIDNIFEKLSDDFDNYKTSEKKLQVIEIAVNEGTNKDFIQSVLTELIQNSTDAIRSTNGNNNIDIFIGENKISMKDYVGFENLLDIMIPFLSSKDPNDPNVTGELGTGFFNAYRQPYTKRVIITSIFNGKKRIISGEPIVIENNVTDIIYMIDINDTKEVNSTEVQLIFHDDIKLLSRLIADATIFTNNYLSFIPGIICKCNNISIQKQFENTFSNSGVNFYIIDDITTESYVMTNGIPLMSLKNFILSFENNDLSRIFNLFCENSIILNISKDIYTPTQSRSKIQFKFIGDDLINLITSGLYYSIMNLYCMDNYKGMRDEIIPGSSYSADPLQLKLSSSINNIRNFVVSYNSPLSICENINTLIDKKKYPDNSDGILMKVAKVWFGDKKYSEKNENGGEIVRKISPPISFKILQPFIDIYWSKIKILHNSKVIVFEQFKDNAPPKILIGEIDEGTCAFYRPSDHVIIMNSLYYNSEKLRVELLKFKGIKNATFAFTMNNEIKKYFSSCLPACTLIHEIGHAIDNKSHSSSAHGITNIKVRNSDYLDFDNMAISIYQEAIGIGLIDEFLKTVV